MEKQKERHVEPKNSAQEELWTSGITCEQAKTLARNSPDGEDLLPVTSMGTG